MSDKFGLVIISVCVIIITVISVMHPIYLFGTAPIIAYLVKIEIMIIKELEEDDAD